MLNHRTIVLIKNEVTYNVDPVPVAASNAVLVENPQWSFSDARMNDRAPARVSQGKLKPLYGGTLVQFTFEVEVKGSGAAGTAPELGQALQACGLSETIVAATSVTYKPASSAQKSCTIYFFKDGKRIIGTGCVGMVSGSLQIGSYAKFSFTFVGHLVSEADIALPTATYLANTPPVLIGVPFVVDSRTPALTKLDFDLGIEIAKPSNIVAADGFGQLQITGRKVSCSFDDEDVLVATYNWLSKWQLGTAISLTTGVIGSVAGNRFAVTLPAVTYTEQSQGDKSGIVTREISGHAAESTTDDEISIAFT